MQFPDCLFLSRVCTRECSALARFVKSFRHGASFPRKGGPLKLRQGSPRFFTGWGGSPAAIVLCGRLIFINLQCWELPPKISLPLWRAGNESSLKDSKMPWAVSEISLGIADGSGKHGCAHHHPIGDRNPIRKISIGPTSAADERTAKGASGKGPRQETSKIARKRQKHSRHFSSRAKSPKFVKKCQKSFRDFSTIFARHQFPAPFMRL